MLVSEKIEKFTVVVLAVFRYFRIKSHVESKLEINQVSKE